MADLRFDNRVAIVTGAGNGLGRSHALFFASRGAKVVVNDLGGSAHGEGRSSSAADGVVAEIKEAGGQAVANYDSVEDGARIVACAMDTFGGVDIVVNNAGILRDVSFQKMTEQDWELVYRVHLLGAFRVTHAAWNHMRDKGYGRVIFTTSAAGIYGNFGQANYSAAKLALVGLAQTLAIEGKKKGVFANAVAPIAGSRMTETVLPPEVVQALKPEFVTPLVGWLCHESCEETGGLFEVGGGFMGKLRWERSEGHVFRLARPLSVEQVQAHWGEISGFEKTAHPSDVTASMQPILGNLGTAKSKGGNDLIDLDLALGYEAPTVESSYDERDVALYALGVGAARDPLDDKELQTVYELHGDGMRVLPTFGVVPALNVFMKMARDGSRVPGLNYGFDRVLHGEQYTEIKYPLPGRAKLTHKTKIKDIFDKGKHATVVTATTSYDEDGQEIIYNELTTLVRGAGGWGGDRGPSADVNAPPSRAPDAVISETIPENQALLYRLSGDWNPLHADPAFAKTVGFRRPILHGLCTFGIAARHVIKAFCDGDTRYFKSIRVRFADAVVPGDTITTEMWKESDTKIVFRCRVNGKEKDAICNAAIELYENIPTKPAKTGVLAAPAPAAGATTAAPGDPVTAIFNAIAHHVETHGELTKIGKVFQFKLSDPAAAWVIDLRDAKVYSGVAPKADTTLELSQQNWIAMATGKAAAQKLYFGGELKISGDVMASQKLEFLKQIKPATAGGGDARAEGDGNAPAVGAPTPRHVFAGIRHHVETHPELVQKVQTVYQWKLTSPESSWILDVKNGAGSVEEGIAANADTTLELSEADFLAMTSGQADAQKLYFGGKLKISGNVMASQKLEFLKQIDREAAAAAASKVNASASPKTRAEGAPPAASRLPAAIAALKERFAGRAGLGDAIGGTVQFKVGESAFNVSAAGFADGVSDARDATLIFKDEEDFLALARAAETTESLFMRGKLRVDGDVRFAHALTFLDRLI